MVIIFLYFVHTYVILKRVITFRHYDVSFTGITVKLLRETSKETSKCLDTLGTLLVDSVHFTLRKSCQTKS